MNKKQGFTLIEVTVASFVFSILLLVSIQVMIPALRAWSDGQKRSELSQASLVTSNWLGDDVLRSSPSATKLTDEGVLVLLCTPGSQRTDHNNEFSELVAYWRSGTDLFRANTSLTSTDTGPPTVTLAELDNFDSKRRVAAGVQVFTVTVPQPWQVDLHLELEKLGRNAEIVTSYTSMYAPFDPNVENQSFETGP